MDQYDNTHHNTINMHLKETKIEAYIKYIPDSDKKKLKVKVGD